MTTWGNKRVQIVEVEAGVPGYPRTAFEGYQWTARGSLQGFL